MVFKNPVGNDASSTWLRVEGETEQWVTNAELSIWSKDVS